MNISQEILTKILQENFDFYLQKDNGYWAPFPFAEFEIYFAGPPEIQDSFLMPVAHLDGLFEFIKKESTIVRENYHFYRYIIIYNTYVREKLKFTIISLIQACQTKGAQLFDVLNEYCHDENFSYNIINPSDYWLVAANNPPPTYTWQFSDTTNFNPKSKKFDERLSITITWIDQGEQKQFCSYWYIASVDFFKDKLLSVDPYYRRYTIICDYFKEEYITEEMAIVINYLATRPMDTRIKCLQHIFEYDGQTMFYER